MFFVSKNYLLNLFLLFFSLDIILETPIVVLPETTNSPNVLVAQLGQISIVNADICSSHKNPEFMALPPGK